MACIKSASRSALAAFAPDAPYLAAGTMAGAVDLSFSSSANLEIFELDFKSDAQDLPVVGSCASSERFNRLSWGSPPGSGTEEYSLGLVAGGLADGSIGVWNPLKLISSKDEDNSFVGRLDKHTGPVRGLEFSAHAPNLLASGADEGELCVWDLKNPTEPSRFPPLKVSGSSGQTEVSFVSWNSKFQHILASTSYNGLTVVWDLRQQKPVTSFSDRRRCSVLQWNPDNSTQLILASDDDSLPSLRVWDVRKTISPSREFVGHTKGVIAMSWCPNDSSFLLTCAKDNRTICWDTNTGEIVCELPASNNWNFDVHWYPKVPGVISASSFDAKIGIYNIEACSRLAAVMGEFGAPARLKAPKWLKRPAGASFGFGGKLVSFQPSSSTSNTASCLSEVFVHSLVIEQSLVSRATEFEATIRSGEKTSLRALCEKKSQDSESEDDKRTWSFLRVMFEEDGTARTTLLAHLGFNSPQGSVDVLEDIGKKLATTLSFDGRTFNGSLVEGGGEGSDFSVDNGEEFFNNPQLSGDNDECDVPNGIQIPKEETEEPPKDSDPSFDDSIQRALVVGDYKGAVLQCIAANRMADALIIAHQGPALLFERTRDHYLDQSSRPYLKVITAMVNDDLIGLVKTRPLDSWKETLALLCTFAQGEEWPVLCNTLASRLMAAGNTLAATLCFICAGNIDKTVEIWSRNLKPEDEGRTYVDLLQDLMEKTIVLAFAIGQKRISTSLSRLVENYVELLASQGLLTTAMEYLNLLYPEDSSHELAILRDRIARSVTEVEAPKTTSGSRPLQPELIYEPNPTFGKVDDSQHNYQVTPQPNAPYVGGYQHDFGTTSGGYQPMQPKQPFQDYINPSSFPPAQSPNVFVPSQALPVPQPIFPSPAASTQPLLRSFVPATPIILRNADQYQQPTLASQLYPGNATFEPARPVTSNAPPPQSGPVSSQMFGPVVTTTPLITGFVPGTNPGFVQRPNMSSVQPSSPPPPAQVQPISAPAPPATIQTVDTSNVPAELRPVIATLTRLFNETSEALGGPRANITKKREIDESSKKIGSLFFKLNSGDISPNVASKLGQLCLALDSGDFAAALHIQVLLTTSDWDECNFWLSTLKRMIKTRQNVRLN